MFACPRCQRRFPKPEGLTIGQVCGTPLWDGSYTCDGTLIPWKTQIPADKRGIEMMSIKGKDLPAVALEFVKQYSRRIGICMEVYISCYSAYAYVIEGLELGEDDLYHPPGDCIAMLHEIRRDQRWPRITDTAYAVLAKEYA